MIKYTKMSAIITIFLTGLQSATTHAMLKDKQVPPDAWYKKVFNYKKILDYFHPSEIHEKDQTPSPKDLMFKAIKEGNFENLRKILDKNPELAKATEVDNDKLIETTALHIATKIKAIELDKEELVETTTHPGTTKTKASENIITLSESSKLKSTKEKKLGICRITHLKIIKLLIKNGADVNAKNRSLNPFIKEDEHGETPLHVAVRAGDLEVVQYLVEAGAKVEETNSSGFTALHFATFFEYTDIVKYLIKSGAKIDAKEGIRGSTVFLLAAEANYFTIIKFLLDECKDVKIEIDEKNNDGMTALLYAAMHGNITLLDFLIKKKANLYETNQKGWTALHNAVSAGQNGALPQIEMVKHLKELGLKIDTKAKDGKTTLQIAVEFAPDIRMIQYLIDEGMDVNESDNNGKTALHIASKDNKLERLVLLISKGAKVDQLDKQNNSALSFTTASKPITLDTLKCTNYLVFAWALENAMHDKIRFEDFAHEYLKNNDQNTDYIHKLLVMKKLLPLNKQNLILIKEPDKKKQKFPKAFNLWYEQHNNLITSSTLNKSLINPINNNFGSATTTNGLTTTNLNGNLSNKKK